MANKTSTFESLVLLRGEPDSVFYTHKKDKDVTALATYYERSVRTERLVVISGSKDRPVASTITKVTIIK